ncbi:hypothetical protein T11_104 [Trichinella zimbabwensis]|uniref:Uncharacterized protein n=1 Tax=Trichinella zimbabwensis TaxID=268475 RepID=A0A0V1HRX5_9BILA|nr:hypothetical protein T11_104 [Trichinella zimbabwensis]
MIIKHRYGDRYLHNRALEIGFRGLEISKDLLLIGHFIFAICFPMCALLILLLDMQEELKNENRIYHRLECSAKVSLQTNPYLWNNWPLKMSQCLFFNAQESSPSETLLKRNQHACISIIGTFRTL